MLGLGPMVGIDHHCSECGVVLNRLLLQAVEDCETRLPPDSNQLALALMQLGNILMSKLEMEEAKAQLDRALEMVQRNSKGIPGMAARSRLALARWHHLSGNRERAGELYRRSIKDLEAVLPATHPDLITAIEDFQLISSEIELSDEQFEPAGAWSAPATISDAEALAPSTSTTIGRSA